MRVVVLPEVRVYLKNLPQILYQKEYFGFEEQAAKYAIELLNDINLNLPTRPSKPAPPHFDRYGKSMRYATFRKSKHTHWYVFFRIYRKNGENIYQVRYITNNHVAAQHL